MSKKHRQYGIPDLPEALPQLSEVSSGDDTAMLYDMHCHLDMTTQYMQDINADLKVRGKELIAVPSVQEIAEMSAKVGIQGLMQCACELDSAWNLSQVLDELEHAEGVAKVYGAAAIHPNEATLHYFANDFANDFAHSQNNAERSNVLESAPDGLEPPEFKQRHFDYDIEGAVAEIARIVKSDQRIRIIGETGLDYFRSPASAKQAQMQSFRAHIALAKELELPLQIHDREAHSDVITTLRNDTPPKTVLFHSFSGDKEMAKICIQNGWYMSFSGPISFKANDTLREAFKCVWDNAKELLLIETDSPFLTPHPFRGRPNIPAMIPYTLRFLSDFLEVELSELCKIIAHNEKNVLT